MPIAANDCSTCALAPSPIATIAITAATPMMMPSVVRNERILLRISACRAIRMVCSAGHAPCSCSCFVLGALRDRLRQRLARVLRLLRAVDRTRPSFMRSRAPANSAMSGSCVTSTMVMPGCDHSSWNSAITSMLVSRVEVAGRLVGEDHLAAA